MPARKKIDPLPDTLSGLIRVALKDLKKAEASPKYKIDMWSWHFSNGKVCNVCYAGSVMAFSLKCSPLTKVEPDNWWNGLQQKFEAINYLRAGAVSAAAACLREGGLKVAEEIADRFDTDNPGICRIPDYGPGKRRSAAFHAAQTKLMKALAKAGL